MDTIIYFCRKRNIEEPLTEAIGQKTYLLIRVSLNVGRERWFGWRLESEVLPERGRTGGPDVEAEPGEKRRISFWRRLGAGRRKRKMEKQVRLEQERRRARQQAMTEQVRQEIRSLSADVLALAGEMSSCRYVYEDSVRDCLVGRKEKPDRTFSAPSGALGEAEAGYGAGALGEAGTGYGAGSLREAGTGYRAGSLREAGTARGGGVLQELWRECWQGEEFTDYGQWEWASRLLPQAVQFHFVVLGNPSCVSKLLEHCARRMKSLRWFLPEAEYTEELEDLLEDFYEEYGLAPALQLLPGKRPYSRVRMECPEPCNILDFTEEACIASSSLPEGSVWIDMASREEKARRLAVRGGIKYVSLKEYWKKLPKRSKPGFSVPRDTAPEPSLEQLPLFMRQTDNEP